MNKKNTADKLGTKTIETKAVAKLLVFALRSLSSEADAAILALSAYAAALRRALSSKDSILLLCKVQKFNNH
jgi:hypothetical protein